MATGPDRPVEPSMRTLLTGLVGNGSYLLIFGISQGFRAGTFQIRTESFRHGFGDMDSESSKESFAASSSLIPDAWGEVAWKLKGFHEDSVTFVVARLVPSSAPNPRREVLLKIKACCISSSCNVVTNQV